MTNPYLIDTPFAINGDKNVIQDTERAEPNNPTWSTGWDATTSTPINGGGKPPKREDFNGVLYAVTDNLVHQAKGLGYEFDSAFANKIGGYPLGAKLSLTDGTYVVSTINNNTNNPATNMTGWKNELKNIDNSLLFTANNFPTIQEAVDSAELGSSIRLNAGEYDQNFELGKQDFNGVGYASQIKVDAGSYGIKTLQTLPNWDKTLISHLSFNGTTIDNNVGLLFDPADPVAGRRNVEYVTFENLDIAIHKPKGNIGNTFSNLNIHDCNYAIRAMSTWTPLEMHSGNDTWRDFQIDTIHSWAFDYVDTTGGGAIHIKDGIIEYCDGGGIRIECDNDLPQFISPRISNVWFEQVAKGATVDRDGVAEVPRAIKLVNVAMCLIENCKLDNIELVNSSALAQNCRVDSHTMTIDANSNLIVENAYLNGSVPNNVFISSIAKQLYPSRIGANLTLRTTSIRNSGRVPNNSTAAVGVTYVGDVGKKWAIDGDALVYATSVLDGGVQCAELALTSGQTYVLPQVITPANEWVVWGISVKQVGALTGSFKFDFDYNLGDIILKQDEWVHSFGIAKTPTVLMRMLGKFVPSSNGTIRFKDYFVVTFKSEAEAIAFVNSRTSVNTYPEEIRQAITQSVPANSTYSVNVDFLGLSLGDMLSASINKYYAGVEVYATVDSQNVAKVTISNKNATAVNIDSAFIAVKLL